MKYQFIAIEGPIGVGKTTLAQKLAANFKAQFLTDTDADNPYLKSFYKDPAKSAFHTQMHFLASRLQALGNPAVVNPHKPIIADFLLDKDKLFAELTLNHAEWWMYSQIYDKLVEGVPKPDLVVYLQAPMARLIERIERRGNSHERRIDSHYLEQLSALYERFFHSYNDSLLIINTADINLADNSDHISQLCQLIADFDGGRHFFNPLATC